MPKGRMLNKKISKDIEVAKLSCKSALLYSWCIPHLDVEGRIEATPEIIKGVVVPYRKDFSLSVIQNCVKEIAKTDDLIVYYGDTHKYMQFLGFAKNQTLNREREAPSEIPSPTPEELQSKSNKTPVEVKSKLNISLNINLNIIESIISDLNSVLNTSYKIETKITQDLIMARLAEGFTLDNFKTVHRNMFKRWGPDNKMREFLRPITLYSRKFESYLNIKQELPISTEGAKAIMAGKSWLGKKEVIDVTGQE